MISRRAASASAHVTTAFTTIIAQRVANKCRDGTLSCHYARHFGFNFNSRAMSADNASKNWHDYDSISIYDDFYRALLH